MIDIIQQGLLASHFLAFGYNLAVWGQISTGGGHSQLVETMRIVGSQ